MSKQALSQLKEGERNRTISLAKLEALAEAMNCKLVYGFIPKRPLVPNTIDLERRQSLARKRHRSIPRPA